jgi:hypothetical protein
MSYQFINHPAPVGYWRIGGPQGLRVYTRQRPGRITRVMCRLLLEWEWIDG